MNASERGSGNSSRAAPPASDFEAFFERAEPRLRRTLSASFGPDLGRDGAAEALAYAWQHWERVAQMHNPDGYLYRVGRSHCLRMARRDRRTRGLELDRADPARAHQLEPKLDASLRELTDRQRACLILVEAFEWRLVEVSATLGISVSSVRRHHARALARVRRHLGAEGKW